ncbi:hypothetical protein SELMODRAFT_94218 [Selaginella moellendorffii]|uniref:Prefoldin subunit 5 n=2 Tax=Selaginella moellendorffii TaxID=88036 RepID=D8RIJ2_SELML|nr:hypothetical protein SELMODRAFT_236211 [Selaginella moellendorffii]EFJ28099.1 hypothetical protein SELMODRAFT_94218 [Selaginella moellendorffii]
MEEVSKLSVDQIRQVKDQVDGELSVLQDSVNNIRTAANRFEMAAKALQNLSQHPNGKKLLVPLTASLYVPGTLQDVEKVLIDVGTGYYIEKSVTDGKDYCDRKINFLKANHEKLMEVASEKRNVAEQVNMVLQAKLRQVMASK